MHMALEQPYTSSVASVLISVTTDMSPTGDLLVTSIFAGEAIALQAISIAPRPALKLFSGPTACM